MGLVHAPRQSAASTCTASSIAITAIRTSYRSSCTSRRDAIRCCRAGFVAVYKWPPFTRRLRRCTVAATRFPTTARTEILHDSERSR